MGSRSDRIIYEWGHSGTPVLVRDENETKPRTRKSAPRPPNWSWGSVSESNLDERWPNAEPGNRSEIKIKNPDGIQTTRTCGVAPTPPKPLQVKKRIEIITIEDSPPHLVDYNVYNQGGNDKTATLAQPAIPTTLDAEDVKNGIWFKNPFFKEVSQCKPMLPITKASSGEDLLQCPESKDQMSQPNLDVDLLPKSMHEQILESLLEDNLRSGIHTDREPANRNEKETKENEGQNKADEREECIIGQKLSKQRVAVSSRLYAKPVKHVTESSITSSQKSSDITEPTSIIQESNEISMKPPADLSGRKSECIPCSTIEDELDADFGHVQENHPTVHASYGKIVKDFMSSTEVEHMIIDVSPLDFLDDLHERSMESPSSQIVSEVNHEQTSTDMLSSLLVSQDEEKEWNITIRTDIWETEESQ